MKRRTLRLFVQMFVLLLATGAGLTGCVTEFAAEKLVAPPNGGRVAVTRAAAYERISPFIDDAFRIDVGRGRKTASMMVWVVEPKRAEVFNTRDPRKLPQPETPGGYAVMKTGPTKQGVSRGIYQVIRYPAHPDAELRHAAQPAARGTVIILQGYSCHVRRNAYLWPWAAVFADAGYRVIMPDLRGHGDSTGGAFTWGIQETEDLSELIDELEDRGLLSGKLALFGHSTGASVAIASAAHDERVACVVAVSPWASLRGAIEGFRDWKLPWLSWAVNDHVLDAITARAGRVGGFRAQDANAAEWIRHTDKPVLLLHGGSDTLLPASQSEAIYAARPENTELVIYPGDDHWSHLELHFTDVKERSLAWFDRNLDEPKPIEPPQIAVVDE